MVHPASDAPGPSGHLTPQARIANTLHAGQYGTWECTVSTGELLCDEYLLVVLGRKSCRSVDEYLELVARPDRDAVREAFLRAAKEGAAVDVEHRFDPVTPAARTVRVVGQPIAGLQPTTFAGVVVDTTDRNIAQARLAFLARAGEVLGSSLDLDVTLQQLCDLAIEELADWCSVDLRDGPGVRLVAVSHRDPAMVRYAREMRERLGVDLDADIGLGKVLRTGLPDIIPTIDEAMIRRALADLPDVTPADTEQFVALGLESSLVVPLTTAAGRVIGALTLVSATPGRVYTPEDVKLAVEVARRAATAVDNAQLYARVEHAALTLQRSLLPPVLPALGFAELAAHYRPLATSGPHGEALIGGDFYDVFLATDNRWCLLIGDVSGKGVDAAALTAAARWTLRSALSRTGSPAEALEELNRSLLGQDLDGRFLTVLAAVVEPAADGAVISYASGGHTAPVIVRGGERVDSCPVDGLIVGAFDRVHASTFTVTVARGDSLVLFTDGLTEARRGETLFGEQGVRQALERCHPPLVHAVEAVDALVAAVNSFGTQRDDMAILALTIPPA